MELRPYQKEAVKAVFDYLCDPSKKDKNPCVEICTGGGKSHVMGQIVADTATQWNGRILLLAHVKELLEQNAEKIRLHCPDLDVGIYSAGLGSRDTKEQVIVAGIQSVYKRADELGDFDLILIDECQLLPNDGDGMYRTFLARMKERVPHLRVVGFTATPYRTETGPICTPDGILNDICYSTSIKLMIKDGYLSNIRSKASKNGIKTANINIKVGEFVAAEVEALVNNKEIVARACKEIISLTKERKAIILFCASVDHCHNVAKEIEALTGEECAVVTGETPASERAEILHRIRGNEGYPNLLGEKKPPLRFLANVNVCAVGFDAPNIDCVAILRPTASPGLYVQMAGRGLRLSPGKEDCLILDYGENIQRHGPLDDVRKLPRPRDKRDDVRICPVCDEVMTKHDMVCPNCEYEFPPPQAAVEKHTSIHKMVSSTASILSDDKRVTKEKKEKRDEVYNVTGVSYHVHYSKRNPEAPPMIRVDFSLDRLPFKQSVWKQPNGQTYWQRAAFKKWWQMMLSEYAYTDELPRDAIEAVDAIEIGAQFKRPSQVTFRYTEGDKFPKDVAYEFEEE